MWIYNICREFMDCKFCQRSSPVIFFVQRSFLQLQWKIKLPPKKHTFRKKQTEHHPEKTNVWILRYKKWTKINRKMNANHMFKPWIFQLRHGFSTWNPTSTRCAMDCAIKAREKPKALEHPGEDTFQPGSKNLEYICMMYIYIYIYICMYASYVCVSVYIYI